MVTRLRSDKGSFVRSPKGAFDSESTPLVVAGQVLIVQDVADTVVYDGVLCAPVTGGGGTPGRLRTYFRFVIPVASASKLAGSYVGLTSGATWDASTLGARGALCGAPTQLWTTGTPITYPAGDAYPTFEHMNTGNDYDVYTNYGNFPGALHPTGFTASEDFAFVI